MKEKGLVINKNVANVTLFTLVRSVVFNIEALLCLTNFRISYAFSILSGVYCRISEVFSPVMATTRPSSLVSRLDPLRLRDILYNVVAKGENTSSALNVCPKIRTESELGRYQA